MPPSVASPTRDATSADEATRKWAEDTLGEGRLGQTQKKLGECCLQQDLTEQEVLLATVAAKNTDDTSVVTKVTALVALIVALVSAMIAAVDLWVAILLIVLVAVVIALQVRVIFWSGPAAAAVRAVVNHRADHGTLHRTSSAVDT